MRIKGLFYATAVAWLLAAGSLNAEIIDRIAAVVNDSIITLSELNAATKAFKGAKENAPQEKDAIEVKTKILSGIIEGILMKQASEKAGIEVSEKEIDNAIEEVKKENNFTHDALLIALAKSGLTYKEYRQQLRKDIRQAKFMDRYLRSGISVTDEDVEQYYRRNISEFYGPPSYRLKIIMIPSDATDKTERINAVMDGIEQGADFSSLARLYSSGALASEGGDTGYIKKGELSLTLKSIAEGLNVGEISKPSVTPDGVYIIQLIDKTTGEALPQEDVKGVIMNKLYQKKLAEKYDQWLTETKKVSHIEIRL